MREGAGEPLVALEVPRPHERREVGGALRRRGVDRRDVAASPLDDLEGLRLESRCAAALDDEGRVGGPGSPVVTDEPVPVDQEAQPRGRARLEEADPAQAGAADGLGQPHEEPDGAGGLVGLRRLAQGRVQLLDVRRHERAHRGPRLLGVEVAPEAGVEPLELGGVAAQDDAEQPGEQAQLGELPGRGVLPALEELAGQAADLPVVGHLGEEDRVEVVAVAEVRPEAVGERVAVLGVPVHRPTVARSAGGSQTRRTPAWRGSPAPTVAAWRGERRAEAGRQPRPRDDRRVPRLREGGLGPPRAHGHRAGPRRRLGRAAPRRAQRRVPEAAHRRAGRRPQGPQQRHRLRLPAAHRLRLAHGPRRRPRARRRPRPRAAHRRRRRGQRRRGRRRPRGRPVLPPPRRTRHRRVLRRRPLRRVLGRGAPDDRGPRARARPHRPPHRRARGRGVQGRRRGHRPPRARRRPRAHRPARHRPGRERRRRGVPRRGRRRPGPRPLRPAPGQGRVRGRADARRRGRDQGRLRGDDRRPARGRRRPAAASAGSRAPSGCTPATRATASATTRSAPPATTRTRCTG